MKPLSGRSWVAAVFFAVLALGEVAYFVGADMSYNKVAAPPLDDTFIHFQYAKQIARGRFFRYQDGDQVSTGATSFLYPILLAPFWALGLRGVSLIWAAHLLNGFALALAMFFVWSLLRRLTEDPVVAVLGGLLVGMNGWFMWGVASGMAIGVTAASLAAALWAVVLFVQEGRRLPLSLALWFLAAMRPEGLFLSFAMVGGLVLWKLFDSGATASSNEVPGTQNPERETEAETAGETEGQGHRGGTAEAGEVFSWSELLKRLRRRLVVVLQWLGWPIGTALLLGLAPTILLAVLSGHATTNGMLVKSHFAHDMDWVRYLWETGRTIVAVPGRLVTSSNDFVSQIFFVAVTLSLAGLGVSKESGRRATAWVLAACLLAIIGFYGFLIEHVEHHNRYYMPYVPLVAGAAALGIEILARPFGPQLGRTIRRVVLVTIVLLGAGSLGLWARIYARNCADIAGHYLPMVAWMRKNLPKDAKVAVHDAGAIPYLSGRRCYDMIGLVSNEFRPPGGVRSDGFVWETLERIRPGYMVVYPNFFPALTRLPLLEKVHSVRLAHVTIAGGREKTAYRVHWEKLLDSDQPGDRPAEEKGWRLVDQVDVADRVSERSHHYHAGQGSLHGPARFRLAVMRRRQRLLIEGGRVVRTGERFVVRGLTPGKPLSLVLRSRMGHPVELTVSLGDRKVPETWVVGRHRSRFEAWFTVPGSLVSGEQVTIRIVPVQGGDYESLHWFALQP